MSRKSLLALLPLLVAAAAHADPAVPLFIPIHGRLLDGADAPVNGEVTLKYAVYTVSENPQAGEPVPAKWTATYRANVSNGVFSVSLGDTAGGQPSLPPDLFDGTEPRWLGVSVNTGAELRPRLRIGSVPHALLAARALKADLAANAERLGGEAPATFRDASRLTGVAPAGVLGEGSSGITTLGTIATGTWQATPIADAHVASAAAWHDKLDTVAHGGSLAGDGTAGAPLAVVYGTTAGTAAAGNDARFDQLATKFNDYLPKAGGSLTGGLAIANGGSATSLTTSGHATIGGNATIAGIATVNGAATIAGAATVNGTLEAKGSAVVAKDLTAGGDVTAASVRGAVLATNRSAVGLSHNVLFNATRRFTVSQSGPATLALPMLFDGSFDPTYSEAAPTLAKPQVIVIENLPAIHVQAGAWIGWSTRYWPATRFALEVFDVHQGRNIWRLFADHRQTPYGGSDFVVRIEDAVPTKIRLTVYETSGTDGKLGISEFFYLAPEATSPYQGLLTTTETFTGWLANRGEIAGSTAALVPMKYTTVRQNSNSAVFEMQADGTLLVKKAGTVAVHANADVIVKGGCNYATMYVTVNGTVQTQTLAPYTGTYWTQLQGSLFWKVNAGDTIQIRAQANCVQSMDNDYWSTLSVQWTGIP